MNTTNTDATKENWIQIDLINKNYTTYFVRLLSDMDRDLKI
jgi:hypothetical protein